MTEVGWLTCTDPTSMLELLRGTASDRKLRLFGCACCRCIWDTIADRRSKDAVEVTERFVEGLATEDERRVAWEAVFETDQSEADWLVIQATQLFLTRSGSMRGSISWEAACSVIHRVDSGRASGVSKPQCCDLLRDLFGNPFRPSVVDPAWLRWNEGTIPNLAQVIHDERAFARLPILGDALEDAGCDNDHILDHCRKPGQHVRGCWVIDLLTGRK